VIDETALETGFDPSHGRSRRQVARVAVVAVVSRDAPRRVRRKVETRDVIGCE
jgi:hypothetical protein